MWRQLSGWFSCTAQVHKLPQVLSYQLQFSLNALLGSGCMWQKHHPIADGSRICSLLRALL
eukprot:2699587-Amphidinium_carterae.1